ncbi:Nse4 C-terminal-domain-containing protein [Mycena maculata]|uniref:Non-structural maintenance of chromosomes element 4 n=1 Tax=Mycena maculata TaxID=230809 RepID=A0AAD7JQB7_9AGAR|nr:Nse4 C-terminal-domain-containing protein [Mycena maculata]
MSSSPQGSPRKEDLVYDPDQDPEEKRQLRRGYRSLHKTLDDPKAVHTAEELGIKVEQANHLFQKVKNPQEATLDSSFFVKTTTINSTKARGLKFGTGSFDVDDLVTRLVAFMGGYRPPEDVSSDASDIEEDDSPLDWGKIGRRVMAKSRRVPAMGFMLGPLSIEQKQRAPNKQRARLEKNKNDERRPQEIREEDIARAENETTKNVAMVAAVLDRVEKINIFRLVINPESFAQSVENIFHLSFLIHDAKVSLEIAENGETIVFACDPPSDADRETAMADGNTLLKRQMILEFDEDTWKAAIKVFNITEPYIPTRPRARTRIGDKWYG